MTTIPRSQRHRILEICASAGALDDGMQRELDAFQSAERSAAARLDAIAAPFRVGRPVTMAGMLETSSAARRAVS